MGEKSNGLIDEAVEKVQEIPKKVRKGAKKLKAKVEKKMKKGSV